MPVTMIVWLWVVSGWIRLLCFPFYALFNCYFFLLFRLFFFYFLLYLL